jgi:catechol 2,3-dioxygenase-like lactoylglutathione lyase family enzyme
MPKVRHFAIATADPDRSAAFYERSFGFERLVDLTKHPLGDYVILTDGTVNMAFVRFTSDQLGKGSDFTGLHHIGILVEDADEASSSVVDNGANPFDVDGGDDGGYERKFYDPDGMLFDISGHPWLGTSLQ